MNDSDNGTSMEETIADSLNELTSGQASLERTLQAVLSLLGAPRQAKVINLSPDSQILLKSSITTLEPLSEVLPKIYEEMQLQNELLKSMPNTNELQKQISSLLKENERLKTRETTDLADDVQRVKNGVESFAQTANRAGNQFDRAVSSINRSAYAAWTISVLAIILACAMCVSKLYDKAAIKQQGADEQKNFVIENFYIFSKQEYRQDTKSKPWLLTPVNAGTGKGAKK